MIVPTETIKCSKCGWDTGIASGQPMLLHIPPPGIKCPNCKIIIISSGPTYDMYIKDRSWNESSNSDVNKLWN